MFRNSLWYYLITSGVSTIDDVLYIVLDYCTSLFFFESDGKSYLDYFLCTFTFGFRKGHPEDDIKKEQKGYEFISSRTSSVIGWSNVNHSLLAGRGGVRFLQINGKDRSWSMPSPQPHPLLALEHPIHVFGSEKRFLHTFDVVTHFLLDLTNGKWWSRKLHKTISTIDHVSFCFLDGYIYRFDIHNSSTMARFHEISGEWEPEVDIPSPPLSGRQLRILIIDGDPVFFGGCFAQRFVVNQKKWIIDKGLSPKNVSHSLARGCAPIRFAGLIWPNYLILIDYQHRILMLDLGEPRTIHSYSPYWLQIIQSKQLRTLSVTEIDSATNPFFK